METALCFLWYLSALFAGFAISLGIMKWRERSARSRSVLTELVNLKEYKDRFGKDDHYMECQPAAWAKAKDALRR